MKFSIDDIIKHPLFFLVAVIIFAFMTVFIEQNYASVDFLEKRIREVKESSDKDGVKIYGQLGEIKSTMREMDKNILEIYKMVKYQEGRDAR